MANKRKKATTTCDNCGKRFRLTRQDRRFCSPSCKQASYRDKKRNTLDDVSEITGVDSQKRNTTLETPQESWGSGEVKRKARTLFLDRHKALQHVEEVGLLRAALIPRNDGLWNIELTGRPIVWGTADWRASLVNWQKEYGSREAIQVVQVGPERKVPVRYQSLSMVNPEEPREGFITYPGETTVIDTLPPTPRSGASLLRFFPLRMPKAQEPKAKQEIDPPADPGSVWIVLADEAPAIGSGHRRVEVLEVLPSHVLIRRASTEGGQREVVKLKRDIWNTIKQIAGKDMNASIIRANGIVPIIVRRSDR